MESNFLKILWEKRQQSGVKVVLQLNAYVCETVAPGPESSAFLFVVDIAHGFTWKWLLKLLWLEHNYQ